MMNNSTAVRLNIKITTAKIQTLELIIHTGLSSYGPESLCEIG